MKSYKKKMFKSQLQILSEIILKSTNLYKEIEKILNNNKIGKKKKKNELKKKYKFFFEFSKQRKIISKIIKKYK